MGPLIFIVFIVDIVNVSSDVRITMFADDVSCSHENPVDLNRIMNASLELLRRWFVANKITLNVKKEDKKYSPLGPNVEYSLHLTKILILK